MNDYWASYWWLIFPVGWFVFGAWDRWLSYQRNRDALDLIKSYVAQGKEPPAELLSQAKSEAEDDTEEDLYRGRRGYRRYRRHYRRGPSWDFRSGVTTAAVAGAFWVASVQGLIPGTEGPFRFVAIILTCIAGANLAFALISMSFREK
jgi:hypothetical protein